MPLSCDLKDIAQAASGCEEQFAGLGMQIYVAYPEDLTATPEYEENGAKFTEASFTFKSGKGAWKFRIKKQTGQITSTGNEGAKGWNVQLLFTIDKDVENTYYVVYDPVFGTEINSNYDSGTTPDSDSGHSVTVTSNPNRYPLCTWTGTLTMATEASADVGG